ncbi:hypothetical protein D3C80_1578790 [compost metagenome]
MCPGTNCRLRCCCAVSVDGDDAIVFFHQCFDDRDNARDLRFGIDRSSSGPGRFSANINDRRSIGKHLTGHFDGPFQLIVVAAIGK